VKIAESQDNQIPPQCLRNCWIELVIVCAIEPLSLRILSRKFWLLLNRPVSKAVHVVSVVNKPINGPSEEKKRLSKQIILCFLMLMT
jgi:hypothetical protein